MSITILETFKSINSKYLNKLVLNPQTKNMQR